MNINYYIGEIYRKMRRIPSHEWRCPISMLECFKEDIALRLLEHCAHTTTLRRFSTGLVVRITREKPIK